MNRLWHTVIHLAGRCREQSVTQAAARAAAIAGIRTATFAALLLVFALMLVPAAQATGRADCLSLTSKILRHSVGYCILLPPSYDVDAARRYPILYFLHGLGENEQFLVRGGGLNLVEDLWEQHEIGDYLIVTPAADSSFYINSHDGQARYEDFVIQEFLPFVERRYRTRHGRAARGIGGISMGGYGALHLAFHHPELFGSVSAHSAALIERLPEAAGSSRPPTPGLRMLGNVFGAPVDRAFWERNDPLALARTANLAGLKIYFDCGSQDDYGFEAGTAALDKELTARRIPHEFHIYPGRHDWPYFAEHLHASLEFESQAFGSGNEKN
jgi:S-formylglutathione hydrolase FrmB